jgi:hypothetical protein
MIDMALLASSLLLVVWLGYGYRLRLFMRRRIALIMAGEPRQDG